MAAARALKAWPAWAAVALLALATGLQAAPREALWKEVEEARQKGLPRTAVEELDAIIRSCLAEKADAEAVKAIALRAVIEADLQGSQSEGRIRLLQAELGKASTGMRPVMEALLADWFWHYFLDNRWQLAPRTPMAAINADDFRTWDLKRLLAEIDRHFTAALADPGALQAIPIKSYDQVILPGSVPDRYRPTLFDFLANEALDFYEAGEQAAVEAEDAFVLSADSPIFDEAAAFGKWEPAANQDEPAPKAIHLYQALLEFHRRDRDRSAFLDADLGRIVYGHKAAVGEKKGERFQDALRRLIAASPKHEISARAIAILARQIEDGGDPVAALALARRGWEAYPETSGGAECYNLALSIEAKSIAVKTESTWTAPGATLDVEYRNVTRAYFRAFPLDFRKEVEGRGWNLAVPNEAVEKASSRMAPALGWSADLPPTKDFKPRTERLPAPKTLKPGLYLIEASDDPAFASNDHAVSIAAVWVTDLALVLRVRTDGGRPSGVLVKAESGEPVPRATVHFWAMGDDGRFAESETGLTDEDGRFEVPNPSAMMMMMAEAGGQMVSNAAMLRLATYPEQSENEREEKTIFFTDRELYRPGQTIRFKGITIQHEAGHADCAPAVGRTLTVVFADPNGREVARQDRKTNDFGSFSGEFTAPRDRLTGAMSIYVLDGEGGAGVTVEEYKRPKFQVEIDPPADAPRLGNQVILNGRATAYTGAALGGAKVKWRVERAAQPAYWCWWAATPATKAVAHGSAVTAPDGGFKVQFPAEADPDLPAKDEPIFSYVLDVDVTDTTGETRTGQRMVRAGYTSMQAALSADEWETPDRPVMFAVTTRSLDGDPEPSQGVVTIEALIQPTTMVRAASGQVPGRPVPGLDEPVIDPANPDSWALGPKIASQEFKTDAGGSAQIVVPLPAGIYRASLEARDRFGAKVSARQTVMVIDPGDPNCRIRLPGLVRSHQWKVEPGGVFTALWGTGYETGRALVEMESHGRLLKRFWTTPGRTQEPIELPVTESMRGGVSLQITSVRENRAYLSQSIVEVPWSNKDLDVKWEHFRSKLAPGGKETWTAIVAPSLGKRAKAEMVATLYDAALDQFAPHAWPRQFDIYGQEETRVWSGLQSVDLPFREIGNRPGLLYRVVDWKYRAFPSEIAWKGGEDPVVLSPFVVDSTEDKGSYRANGTLAGTRIEARPANVVTAQALSNTGGMGPGYPAAYGPGASAPALSSVIARRNLNETAFFYPHLLADDDGAIRIAFTAPEALTEWRFMAFAHDQTLRSGYMESRAVTAKDLMVEANPPRFVREGDTIEFVVKVSNQASQEQTGRVKLTFAEAATLRPSDESLGNRSVERAFDIPAHQSRSYSWRIAIPDGLGLLTYRAVGSTALASDGEEGYLPVLGRQVLVTESLPLTISGRSTQEFELKNLLASGESRTLRSQSFTVQMVSQPAWYAVSALPYIMEFPYECNEQTFNRFYANALARHIANSDPKIRRIFDIWKGSAALQSPLERNQDLKSVLLEATPWMREAQDEGQARRNIGLLFDDNRLDDEANQALRQLADRQWPNGFWSWFPGGPPNEYISLYIMAGFGRLRRLGVEVDLTAALRAVDGLDNWMAERYRLVNRLPHPEEFVPSGEDALYLYGRSFFLRDRPIPSASREAVDFFLRQSRRFWVQTAGRQSQAHLAVALRRFGDPATAAAVVKSLKERSARSQEMGMHWEDSQSTGWWGQAPVETQAMMIEAFDEVAGDTEAVEACKVWLLKQKEAQAWKTTKATADAVYALLLRGANLLGNEAIVEVALGGDPIKPNEVEAGTGFFERRFSGPEIRPSMGRITVKKADGGVSWGGAFWQYLDDRDKVSQSEDQPLSVTKRLFVRDTTAAGQILRPVNGPVEVGDALVVRLELRADRDMEFVHLRDERASGTEPADVLSGYRFQDGLAYYETIGDTATHFFIDYLPKGVYVFEYSSRVQLRGAYRTGSAEIESMYAPEFRSHSESFTLEAR